MDIRILFVRVWSIIAILLGLLLTFFAIKNIYVSNFTTDDLFLNIVLFGFGVVFILLGRFLVRLKMQS